MTNVADSSRPRSAADREVRGKDARAAVPRSVHGEWAPAADRRDPVEILEAQAVTRVQELVPIRYGRMLNSAFAFYRGAAALFAADMDGRPVSGIRAQLCGDAHISNFGVFSAPDRSLVFDLNDFDETLPGPWEWDVKRMAASVEIGGRDIGLKPGERRAAVLASVASYREAIRNFAAMSNLDVWYTHLDVTAFVDRASAKADKQDIESVRRLIAKAQGKTSLRALKKLTGEVDGKLQFLSAPPLLVPMRELLPEVEALDFENQLRGLIDLYGGTLSDDRLHLLHQFEFVDIARKVVGVGSVGTRAWVILLQGRDKQDPLILQAKEAGPSVLEPYTEPTVYETQGRRVVEGQRLMQAASDVLLGWQHVTGIDGVERDFYLRQLWDGKGSAEIETMDANRLKTYAGLCGWTLARAHARSGDRVAIASYLGGGTVFDEALATFSEAYADQNDADYAALSAAADSGRIEVQRGV